MNCEKCNAPLTPGDMFCPGCGAPVPQQQPQQPQPVYNPMYTPAPKQKSNAGLIVAIVMAVIAVCAAIVTVVMILFNPTGSSDESAPTEVVYTPPVFDYAEASSTRSYDVDSSTNQRVYYYSEFIMDDDMKTAWTPDRNIDPVPSITLHAYEKQRVSGIKMTNGYCKSEKTYTKNRRISKVRVTYSGGETIAEFGMNHYREMLDIPFGRTVDTDYITVQVLDSYYGEWKDIAISEIDVY